jgi:hypothetical protein
MAPEREFEVGLSAKTPQKLPSHGKRITFIAKMIKKSRNGFRHAPLMKAPA